MPQASTDSAQPSKPDYNATSFHGALASDRWMNDDDPEFSTVHTFCVAEVSRAASAITEISRIVHNSLNEPACSGAEPLGLSAQMALLDGLEIIGRYLGDLGDSMRETAGMHARIEAQEAKRKATMHDIDVLSHPNFTGATRDGSRRRRGHPKSVVKIEDTRECRFRVVEGGRLRGWARCAGLDVSLPIRLLRENKR